MDSALSLLSEIKSKTNNKVINDKYKSKGSMVGTERQWLLGKVILTKKLHMSVYMSFARTQS